MSYDASKEDYISIGILSNQEDFCANDYKVIWEMLKKYEKEKVVPDETVVREAIGKWNLQHGTWTTSKGFEFGKEGVW